MRKPKRTYQGPVHIHIQMLLPREEHFIQELPQPVTQTDLEQRIKDQVQKDFPTVLPRSLHVDIQPVLSLDDESMQDYLIDLHKGEKRRKEMLAALTANGVIARWNEQEDAYQLVSQDRIYTLPRMRCERCQGEFSLWAFAAWIALHPWCVTCRNADPLEAKRISDRLRYQLREEEQFKMVQMGSKNPKNSGKDLLGEGQR